MNAISWSNTLSSAWVWWAVALGIGYTVGRVGIPQLYSDIKNLISGIKGAVSGAKAAVSTSTTSAASTSTTKTS